MPSPRNVTELQSFLGLVNFYQVFIKNMHELRALLNDLLKKDKKWKWTTECQAALEKIKTTLTSELFLTHFDPKLNIIVASDASSYGIGACILHLMPDGSKKKPLRTRLELYCQLKKCTARPKKSSQHNLYSYEISQVFVWKVFQPADWP